MKRVDAFKYLGITYDHNMKWNLHIANIVKKTKYLVYVFYKLREIMSKKQLLQIYYGLFHSTAVYGITGWGGLYDTALAPLASLQETILKIIGVKEGDIDKPLDIRQAFVLKSILHKYSPAKNAN